MVLNIWWDIQLGYIIKKSISLWLFTTVRRNTGVNGTHNAYRFSQKYLLYLYIFLSLYIIIIRLTYQFHSYPLTNDNWYHSVYFRSSYMSGTLAKVLLLLKVLLHLYHGHLNGMLPFGFCSVLFSFHTVYLLPGTVTCNIAFSRSLLVHISRKTWIFGTWIFTSDIYELLHTLPLLCWKEVQMYKPIWINLANWKHMYSNKLHWSCTAPLQTQNTQFWLEPSTWHLTRALKCHIEH